MTLADIIKTATALGYQPTRRTAFRRNVALRLDCISGWVRPAKIRT